MLFRLVAADLRTVLKKNILTFIAIAAVTVANLVYAYGLSSVYGVRTNALGFADNLALVFAGSAPFEPRPGLMFVPPLGWLFVILLILYTTLDYPTESLHGFGLQALVRCRSRTLWWASRFISVAAVTAFSLLVVVCSVVIWSLMVSASFSAVIHGESLQLANLAPWFLKAGEADALPFFHRSLFCFRGACVCAGSDWLCTWAVGLVCGFNELPDLFGICAALGAVRQRPNAVALGRNCQRGNRDGLERLVFNCDYVVMPIAGWTVVSKGRPYRKGGQDMSVIVRDVSKRMGKNDVLRNVSIEVDPGTVVGLQGINGSGKTMLMRAVCGLIKPTEGEISIDGQRLGVDISFPPSLGMLIEAPSFLGYLSGYDNLELIAQIKGVDTPEDIRSALRLVGLDADEKKKFRAYSLGMKQRLGIAAAIMEKPKLLVLDEPTNALDEAGVEMLKRVVAMAASTGREVILSSHDGEVLEELADRVYCMRDGAVVKVRERS